MNGVLTFTTNGVPHVEIEEAKGRRIAEIREQAYRQGVADAQGGSVRPARRPRRRRP